VLRKIAPDSPVLRQTAECRALLDEITSRLSRLEKCDRERSSFAKGAELFQAGRVNGVEHALAAALSTKGQGR
jgi:hypothetical protein